MDKKKLIEENFSLKIVKPYTSIDLNEREYKKALDWLYQNSIPFSESVYKSHFFDTDSPMRVAICNEIIVESKLSVMDYLKETGLYTF